MNDEYGRRGGDNKNSNTSFNVALYIALVAVAVMFVVFYLMNNNVHYLKSSELQKLIENTGPGKPGTLEVERDKKRAIYSNLRDVKITKNEVTGKIDV